MKEVVVKDSDLQKAVSLGMDEFVEVFLKAIHEAIGGELSADNMGELNSDQITLLGFEALHNEVMDGGFIQLIHNGWGAFIFRNPFDKAMKAWGLQDLSALIKKGHHLYFDTKEKLERDCSDEEFMALYEQFPQFDDLDDSFVENEEEWVGQVAHYIDDHIENFAHLQMD